jgi:hypothetical protein
MILKCLFGTLFFATISGSALAETTLPSTGSLPPDISRDIDQMVANYLSLQTTLDCRSSQDFDLLLQAAKLVGDWCRAQNKVLKEQGCGAESDFCVDAFFSADMPQQNLIIGVSASGLRTTYNSSDIILYPLVTDGYFWSRSRPNMPILPLTSSSYESTQMSITLSVGVEFISSKKNIKRHTCLNPLFSPLVEQIARAGVQNNQIIHDFDVICGR